MPQSILIIKEIKGLFLERLFDKSLIAFIIDFTTILLGENHGCDMYDWK